VRALIGLFLTLSCSGTTIPVLAFEARGGKYVSRVLSVSADGAVLRLDGHSVRMTAAGGSRRSSLEALDRMPGKANYIPSPSYDLAEHGDLIAYIRNRGEAVRIEYDSPEISVTLAGAAPGVGGGDLPGEFRGAGSEFDECGHRYRRRERPVQRFVY
jgi:hypothetical protein